MESTDLFETVDNTITVVVGGVTTGKHDGRFIDDYSALRGTVQTCTSAIGLILFLASVGSLAVLLVTMARRCYRLDRIRIQANFGKNNNDDDDRQEQSAYPPLGTVTLCIHDDMQSQPQRRNNDDDDDHTEFSAVDMNEKDRISGVQLLLADDDDDDTTTVIAVHRLRFTDPFGEAGVYSGTLCKETGMPHGKGRLEYDVDKRYYDGDWVHGRWTGFGRIANGDGDFYDGYVLNDMKHGHGTMRFSNGRVFEGRYQDGDMIQGKMTYSNGSTYEGYWKEGLRNGVGRCVFVDNSVYEGEFKNGEFEGRAKMTWSDGGWYEGEWKSGEMNGEGCEVRSDGSIRHCGLWHKGEPVLQAPTTTCHWTVQGR
jgi:hypothetical protein